MYIHVRVAIAPLQDYSYIVEAHSNVTIRYSEKIIINDKIMIHSTFDVLNKHADVTLLCMHMRTIVINNIRRRYIPQPETNWMHT